PGAGAGAPSRGGSGLRGGGGAAEGARGGAAVPGPGRPLFPCRPSRRFGASALAVLELVVGASLSDRIGGGQQARAAPPICASLRCGSVSSRPPARVLLLVPDHRLGRRRGGAACPWAPGPPTTAWR